MRSCSGASTRCLLPRQQLIRCDEFRAYFKGASLRATATSDACFFVKDTRACLWVDAQCVYRANGKAGRVWALQADMLEERTAVRIIPNDFGIDDSCRFVEDADTRDPRHPGFLMHI